YAKALITILDANVTTFIAALVLFQFGTGPVRGFAVTLSIGVVASFFTAVFVTRVVFDYLIVHKKWKKMSI
ncbi:MAG: protein translocase subunit SecD, partial [Deltaproteobacteria bacterium]|nr:protein translocase subunit SecD [Deltaproteobacteria bacterium]